MTTTSTITNNLHKVFLSKDLLNNVHWPLFDKSMLPDQQVKLAALTLQYDYARGDLSEHRKWWQVVVEETLVRIQQTYNGTAFLLIVLAPLAAPTRISEYQRIWKYPGLAKLLKDVEKGEEARITYQQNVGYAALAKFGVEQLRLLTQLVDGACTRLIFFSQVPINLTREEAAATYEVTFFTEHHIDRHPPMAVFWPSAAKHYAEKNMICVRFDSELKEPGILFDVYGRQETMEAIYWRMVSYS